MIKFKSSQIKHIEDTKYTVDINGESVKVDITPELLKNLRGLEVAKTDDELETYILEAAMKFTKLLKSKIPPKAWDDLI